MIKNFWRVLEEFSNEERSLYLRFVWGRSRLGIKKLENTQSHVITRLRHANADQALPCGHTW